MHDTERMFESGMHCTWINMICPTELADSPQGLEGAVRNDFTLTIIQGNETVHRATDFKLAMRIEHAFSGTLLYPRTYIKLIRRFRPFTIKLIRRDLAGEWESEQDHRGTEKEVILQLMSVALVFLALQ